MSYHVQITWMRADFSCQWELGDTAAGPRHHRLRRRVDIHKRETTGYIFFSQTSGHFSAVLLATKLRISEEAFGQFAGAFVVTEPGQHVIPKCLKYYSCNCCLLTYIIMGLWWYTGSVSHGRVWLRQSPPRRKTDAGAVDTITRLKFKSIKVI